MQLKLRRSQSAGNIQFGSAHVDKVNTSWTKFDLYPLVFAWGRLCDDKDVECAVPSLIREPPNLLLS